MQGELDRSVSEATQTRRTSRGLFVGSQDAPDTYELERVVGGGGEAEVWQALARPSSGDVTGGPRAVKMFYASTPPGPGWLERVETLSLVHHPGLARVIKAFTGAPPHRAGAADPAPAALRCYLVMDFVPGLSLQEWLSNHPDASLGDRLVGLANVASALSALHRGASTAPPIAHGDVKPDNIRLCGDHPSDGARLVDFGLMHPAGASAPERLGATLNYAAPELLDGVSPTPASDMFAFAATTYQAITGDEPPMWGDGLGPDVGRMVARLREHPAAVARPELPDLLDQGLAADPADRPTDVLDWLNTARRTSSAVASLPRQRQGKHRRSHTEPVLLEPGEAAEEPRRSHLWAVALPTAALLAAVVAVVAWGGGDTAETFPPGTPPAAAAATTQADASVAPSTSATQASPSVAPASPSVATALPADPAAHAVAQPESAAERPKAQDVAPAAAVGHKRKPAGSDRPAPAAGTTAESASPPPPPPAPTAVSVPGVVGQTQGQAQQSLEAAGFTVVVTSGSGSRDDVGRVIGQSPAGGAMAEQASTITITVGVTPTEAPTPTETQTGTPTDASSPSSTGSATPTDTRTSTATKSRTPKAKKTRPTSDTSSTGTGTSTSTSPSGPSPSGSPSQTEPSSTGPSST